MRNVNCDAPLALVPIVIEDQTAYDVANPPAARNHSQQVLADADNNWCWRVAA